ncbi:GATA transcription factor 21-like [Impatiens glandulifera]|uniref:GATA transcription factor 21-like n=1 Tax=Impatiens glandulifera TaxID=253017 RepID=UPI001FB15283|nr:GATA transcription factor 21-like [Impatiens glandulifera]
MVPSPLNLMNLSLIDHHHHHDQQLSPSNLQVSSSSSSSSLSLHPFINPQQLQADQSGSHDHDHPPLINGLNDSSLWNSENTNKSLPTKIRFTGRMLNTSWSTTPQTQNHNPNTKKLEDNNNISSNTNVTSTTPVRVCSDCNTTKTPLWRSGPRGPKTLCNACGIRQRKARRAMAAAAAAAGNGSSETRSSTPVVKIITKVQNKIEKKRSSNGQDQYLLPYNKRFRDDINNSNNDDHGITKGLCFEDFFMSLTKKLAFHRVFPKDEEEAAILLMALSSGLLHG